jgi:hypothetical protein
MWYQSVSKPFDWNQFYYEEDYYEGVCCYSYVIDLVVSNTGA